MAFKGITFDKQLFKSGEFALMAKKFFNSVDGRIQGVTISNTSTTIVIGPGYFISSGYYTKITSDEIISVTNGTWTLIYEIDLTKINTTDIFLQGSFKLINTTLRKDDLFNGGTIYQLALATVTMSSGIITLFTSVLIDVTSDIFSTLTTKVDKETGKGLYPDVDKTKLAGIATSANNYSHPATHSADIITDGTTNKAYTSTDKTKLAGIATSATKNEMVLLAGSLVAPAGDGTIPGTGSVDLSYPAGYTVDNCVVISIGLKLTDTQGYNFEGQSKDSLGLLTAGVEHFVNLKSTIVDLTLYNIATSTKTFYYKIVLMKIA